MKKIIAAAVMVGVFTTVFSGCNMIEKTQQGVNNTVLAKVNDEKITQGELTERMKPVLIGMQQQYGADNLKSDQGKQAITQQKQQLLDEMVTEKLLIQKAKSLKIMPSDSKLNAEINKQYNTYKSQQKSETAWKNALSQAGYTESLFKDQIRIQIITSAVENYATKNVKVTDKQISDYYKANPLKYTQQPNTIHLSHILVKTQAEADKIETQLKGGADFAALAKQNSIDTGSKVNGGDLGDYDQANDDTSKQLDATFMKAAVALKAGQISDPVQTQYGWHIIKCDSRNDYPEKPLDQVKADISSTLLKQSQQKKFSSTISTWKKAASITEYTDKIQ
ncbi:MAG: peptidylprolyl isomerase [Clostridium sp.]|nr:peptidylprolyl isomerase [Clostridium sp.]